MPPTCSPNHVGQTLAPLRPTRPHHQARTPNIGLDEPLIRAVSVSMASVYGGVAMTSSAFAELVCCSMPSSRLTYADA